jgi:hypothetical protein
MTACFSRFTRPEIRSGSVSVIETAEVARRFGGKE